jgi:hypothetical protein
LLTDLSREEIEVLQEVLNDAIEAAQDILNMHIDNDQTPETLDEFMELVSDQQERITILQELQRRIGASSAD